MKLRQGDFFIYMAMLIVGAGIAVWLGSPGHSAMFRGVIINQEMKITGGEDAALFTKALREALTRKGARIGEGETVVGTVVTRKEGEEIVMRIQIHLPLRSQTLSSISYVWENELKNVFNTKPTRKEFVERGASKIVADFAEQYIPPPGPPRTP